MLSEGHCIDAPTDATDPPRDLVDERTAKSNAADRLAKFGRAVIRGILLQGGRLVGGEFQLALPIAAPRRHDSVDFGAQYLSLRKRRLSVGTSCSRRSLWSLIVVAVRGVACARV